jgi:hypothetical protein
MPEGAKSMRRWCGLLTLALALAGPALAQAEAAESLALTIAERLDRAVVEPREVPEASDAGLGALTKADHLTDSFADTASTLLELAPLPIHVTASQTSLAATSESESGGSLGDFHLRRFAWLQNLRF